MATVFSASLPANFDIRDLPLRAEPRRVILCPPDSFDVVDVKNVHMEAQAGRVNVKLAVRQWENLKGIYLGLANAGLLDEVSVLPATEGLEDMVFCANPSFPWLTLNGKKQVILSKMSHASRKKEVAFHESFFASRGYEILHLQHTHFFEGMGDCLPHPGRRLLYGGYGYRSGPEAWDEIASLLDTDVLPLQLTDPRFYHLDTCFIPLDDDHVMLCREAFTPAGLNAISRIFKKVIEIPTEEASSCFSLNAHTISDAGTQRKTAILHPGAIVTTKALLELGYGIIETDTSEYMKSGGSVFCMKLMYY